MLQKHSQKDYVIGNHPSCVLMDSLQQKLEIRECVQHIIHILFEVLTDPQSCLCSGYYKRQYNYNSFQKLGTQSFCQK